MPPALPNPSALTEAVVSGDRAALARAITLAESTRADHQAVAREVLAEVLPRTGGAIRVGVTGVPGAGKSTLLDALGGRLIDAGHRVAVLAVDPSSARSGGSILGDKTRMERLAVDPRAFVRPSPTAGTLGGVARRTREALLLCEAAGYDVVFVETVGVGQSETAVAAMTDVFLLLVLAQGGDELQGIKRGIMELADVVAIHKSDLGADAAREAVRRYRSALHLFPPPPSGWTPQVLAASSRTGEGLDDVWQAVRECFDRQKASDYLKRNRAAQRDAHLDETIRAALVERFDASPAVQSARADVEADVRAGRVTPEDGAARLLAVFAQP